MTKAEQNKLKPTEYQECVALVQYVKIHQTKNDTIWFSKTAQET